jgi:hypothetical protein
MSGRVGEIGGCVREWEKLVDAWKSGRNWWMLEGVEGTGGCLRVGETGRCMGKLKKLVDAWES